MDAGRRAVARIEAYVEAHPLAVDVALVATITALGAVLRLALIGSIPYGVHADEAQIGMDARRIMDDWWIGPYTRAALGEPTGHAYLATPFVWLFGSTPIGLRFGFGLVGLTAVPLLYLLVRVALGRVEAVFASALLAVSYWHVFYSRVAHSSSTYPTVVLAVLLCLFLGMRSRNRWWFVAGGALFGLGVYAYNIYPIAVVAIGVFLALITLREYRGEAWAGWWRSIAIFAVVAFIVALPMIVYLADPDAYYWDHFRNYQEVGVRDSPEYKDADFFGKVGLLAGQAKFFASAYAWEARADVVDGNGGFRPMFDPPVLLLLLAGLPFAYVYRRRPLIIAALCCLVIIPLPAVLQRGAIMREPLGAAPFAMLFAALPLAAAWRAARERGDAGRYLLMAATLALVALIGTLTVRDYFWRARQDPLVREIYFSEMTTASEYLRRLSTPAVVYFYSERAPLGLESRVYLAPDVEGEDRSREYSDRDASIEGIDRSRPAVFLLMGAYLELLPEIEARYPGGTERISTRDGKTEFFAYELPPSP